ncbi:sugar transport protein [Oleiphilus messinensis]|uniref:Sugar transport protein n=1 Tax=Oleiphilus messinensis TaxID=141451 RepID=A0A1Y0I7C9_9GAMM|nr:DMT family transporter [Oleiphilus messinensis]ARU56402.1 sugar transport protein [Oleiphilus messinensis]
MTRLQTHSPLFQIPIGIRYMILSAFGFAVMAASVKWCSQSGLPVLEIVAARALISLILSFLDVKRKRLSLFGNRKDLLIARGVVGALALFCVYYAVSALPLAESTVLQYLHPMFTAILAFLFLGERLRWPTLICILFSFAGLLIITRPDYLLTGGVPELPSLALTAAVLGAIGSAIAYVLVRKLSATEDPSVIIFYFPMIALPAAVVLLGNDFIMPQGYQWLGLLLVGVFTQIGQIGLTKAMQSETASQATAFSYLQVLFAVLLGWFVFAEVPVLWTWVGGSLILCGALINILYRPKTT